MPGIRERLELSDGFSGVFDRYIQKLTKSIDKTQEMEGQMSLVNAFLLKSAVAALSAVEGIEDINTAMEEAGQMEIPTIWDIYEKMPQKAEKAAESTKKLEKQSHNFLDGIGKKIRRLTVMFFSLRKIIQYVRNTMERVPDDVAKPFNDLKDNISRIFGGVVGKGMEALAGPLQKLTDFINGEQGTKMIAVLEKIGELIGQGIGVALEMVFNLISLVSENFQTMGITASDVFTVVGGIIGGFYAFFYNIVADIYNALAILGEFVANFLDNPLAAIVRLITDVADWALGILENIAVAIDKVFGSNIASTLGSWRDTMYNWAEEKIGGKNIKLNRMEKLEYSDVIAKFANEGAAFGDSLSQVSYEDTMTSKIKDIDKNTKAIKDSVSKEDLKDIIDMAERRFVNQVNLTAQTPIITINGANTGNSAQDRRLLANAIRDILVEQVAAAPTSPGFAYSGGY